MAHAPYHQFAQRLILAMKNAGHGTKYTKSGVTPAFLVKTLGISNVMAHNYLKGLMLPRENKIRKLAQALDVDFAELRYGYNPPANLKHLPVLTLEELAHPEGLEESRANARYFGVPIPINEKGYLVKITSDEMQSSTGPSFPEGGYIVVDPMAKPENKDYVIVHLAQAPTATFRQLIINRGTFEQFLQPLNRGFPNIVLPAGAKVIGVVVGYFNYFKKYALEEVPESMK